MHWQIIWNRTDRNCNFFFFIKKISFLFPLLSLTARSLDSLPLLYSLSLSSFLLSLSLYFSLPLSLSLSSLPNYHRSLSCSGFFFWWFDGWVWQWMSSNDNWWVRTVDGFKWWWVGWSVQMVMGGFKRADRWWVSSDEWVRLSVGLDGQIQWWVGSNRCVRWWVGGFSSVGVVFFVFFL